MSAVVDPHLRRPIGICAFFALLAVLALVTLSLVPSPGEPAANPARTVETEDPARIAGDYGSLPLSFQPNTGTAANSVDYLTHTQGAAIYLSSQGAAIALHNRERGELLKLRLLGARSVDPTGLERLPGVVNDLRGGDPEAWTTHIPTFERVRYRGLYPGIALDWYGNQRQLEYDFRVAPGADPAQIAIRVAGADAVRVVGNGDLVIESGGGEVRQRAPIAYQPSRIAGRRPDPVQASFGIEQGTVRFNLGAYDKDRPLVIDPLILGYSTYLGGGGSDAGEAIAVASTGSAYVTGWTASEDYDTLNAVDPTGGDPRDTFVSKLSPDGSFLVWSTYLGGSGVEFGNGIAVDANGAVYVTGTTDSADFSTANPIQGALSGGQDAFVTKLPRTGDSLLYSTYLGGSYPGSEAEGDWARGIAVDSTGAAYVVGGTLSTDFPTVGAIEGDSTGEDAFITKLTPSGDALAYSTYLGGNSGDSAADVAVNSSGGAFITGGTSSSDFNTVNQFEGDSGERDVFVSRLTPSGDALAYSSYLGGSGIDVGWAIALDNVGVAYITGYTSSTDYDVAFGSGNLPGTDAFISRFSSSGLGYSTYLGGSDDDLGLGIAVSGNSFYVAGDTRSSDFPLLGAIDTWSGNGDAFVTKRNLFSGAVEYSTVLGGSSTEYATDIAVDSAGAAYIVGRTYSSNFPIAQPIQASPQLPGEVFVSRLASDTDELLARRFQPILRFDEGERWRPLDVERMLSEETHYICEKKCSLLTSFSKLAEYPSGKAYIDIGAPGDPGLAPRSSDPDYYYSSVCPPNGQVVDCESGPRSAIYYDTVKVSPSGYRYIQYWVFYRFNDSPLDQEPFGEYLDHEADWEQMALAVPSTTALTAPTFDFANFGQHGNNFSYLRENLTCDSDTSCGSTAKHVHGFVSGGTHATYAEPCSGIIPCFQSNSEIPETDHGGEAHWANNGDASALRRLPAPYAGTWSKGPHAWVDWPGWWGLDAGLTADHVASPANQTFYDFPWEAACVDGSECEEQFSMATQAEPESSADTASANCGQWFGSGIGAVSCDPALLSATLDAAEVGERSGSVDLVLVRSGGGAIEAATTRGLAQLASQPLRPGDQLLIRGPAEHRGRLLVRSFTSRAITVATFSERQLSGREKLVVERHGSRAVPMLREAGRTSVAPESLKVHGLDGTAREGSADGGF